MAKLELLQRSLTKDTAHRTSRQLTFLSWSEAVQP